MLESQITQKTQLLQRQYWCNESYYLERYRKIIGLRWEGRDLVIWDFSWWPGGLICMTGPRWTANMPGTLLERMDMGMYQPPLKASDAGSRNSQEHRDMCNYTDLTTKLQQPPKQTSHCYCRKQTPEVWKWGQWDNAMQLLTDSILKLRLM